MSAAMRPVLGRKLAILVTVKSSDQSSEPPVDLLARDRRIAVGIEKLKCAYRDRPRQIGPQRLKLVQ